jgi:ribonuclease HI
MEIALLFAAKKYRTNIEPLIPDHIKLIVNKFQLNFSNIIKYSAIQRPPWTNKTNIITELATLKKNSTALEIYLNHFRELISNIHGQYIYTDASKGDQGVGISIILNNCPITYNLSDQCSIYTAEALAIITALKHIKNLSDQNYYILSDSLSTIHSIKNTFNLNDISTKLINKLHKLETSNKNIKFIWIPGHCGIHGNEEADKHAKKAAMSIETPKLNLTTFTDQKKIIKIVASNIWQEHWRNQVNKLREIKQNILQWQSIQKSRKEEIIINRIRIGHTRLIHGYLMDNGEPPNCPSCGVALTVKHVLTECLQFRELREEYHLSTNLYEIVGPDPDAIQNLYMFLKTSKLDKQI